MREGRSGPATGPGCDQSVTLQPRDKPSRCEVRGPSDSPAPPYPRGPRVARGLLAPATRACAHRPLPHTRFPTCTPAAGFLLVQQADPLQAGQTRTLCYLEVGTTTPSPMASETSMFVLPGAPSLSPSLSSMRGLNELLLELPSIKNILLL